MEVVCSLHALIACFSWSNLFIDSGLLYQDSGVEQIKAGSTYDFYDGAYHLMRTDDSSSHYASNPYGRLAIGYEMQFTSVTFALEVEHVSSLDTTKDRGVNAINLKARWYPFR